MGDNAGSEGPGIDEQGADHEGPADGGEPPVSVHDSEDEGDDDKGFLFPFADGGELKFVGGDDGAPTEVAPEEFFHEGDDKDCAKEADAFEGPLDAVIFEE